MENKLRVNKFLVIETGTYNNQFRRPYATEVNSDVVNLVNQHVDSVGNINAHALNHIASQFIMPAACHEGMIGIKHGWDTRRMTFMMEVEIPTPMGQITEMVLGYTEHADVSFNNNLDYDMEFFVNSVSVVRRSVTRSPVGNMTYTNLVGTDHVLVDNEWTDVHNAREWRMRPEDMFATISLDQLNLDPMRVHDGRTASTGVPVLSNRRNSMAGAYAARMLDIHRSAQTISQYENSGDSTWQQARQTAREHTISLDNFLSLIDRANPGRANAFTLRQLKQLDPYCDHDDVMTVIVRGDVTEVHERGQTANWDSSDGTTRAAAIVSQEVPGYMMELGLTNVSIFATNETMGGHYDVRIKNAMGFSDVDLTEPLQLLEAYLLGGVLPGLTFNNQIAIQLQVNCNLMGETFIGLSLNGEPPTDFVVPSFCDAMLSPVITLDRSHMNNVAQDFVLLFDGVNCARDINTTAFGGL